ncbi:MAG: hypothetical protein KatS3mg113_0945 [Planctomycetaceae bacterium]|nr:MAG: hypothetical protein KatS3mg113_0945 [Planctomycetaceae bacterium]
MNERILTVVIPALNEEEAIGPTLERCLAVRAEICEAAGLEDVEFIVVSDGSTDRTAEIARGYPGVTVIEFPTNRGYGAAIQSGWQMGRGEWLGFLDADGTCDPLFFAPMCRLAIRERADIVLGSRLGPHSHMPALRRLGNRLYAVLLGILCGQSVTDVASGMRVVRRSALRDLEPLPSGLHFTPAMSARAILNRLRVLELPMNYAERIGVSKLHVLRDGVRFLRAIIEGVLCYRPEKMFLGLMLCCVVIMTLWAAYPVEYYLRFRRVEDWMIYRFVVCSLLASAAWTLVLATVIAHRTAQLSQRRSEAIPFWPALMGSLFSARTLSVLAPLFGVIGTVFVLPGLQEWVTTGRVTQLHWSRLLAGGLCWQLAIETWVFALLQVIVSLWVGQRQTASLDSLSYLHPPDTFPLRSRQSPLPAQTTHLCESPQ